MKKPSICDRCGEYEPDCRCAESETPIRVKHAILRLTLALNRIIEWNRQTAQDKYGDPNKAESWQCVIEARAALKEAGTYTTPTQIIR